MKESTLPSVVEAIKFRLEQYDHNQRQACRIMNINPAHFNSLLRGKRELSLFQAKALFKYGIPPKVLLQ